MIQSPSITRSAGYRALARELGAAGAASFIRQLENGSGNYTEDRRLLLSENSVDIIAERIKRRKTEQT